LYDGRTFVSQTARGHLEEDQALVALELAHGGHYRREMDCGLKELRVRGQTAGPWILPSQLRLECLPQLHHGLAGHRRPVKNKLYEATLCADRGDALLGITA
jgi:hypothetical protein